VIGGSMVAALLGTFVGNPLTYPFLWFASYKVGNIMLGSKAVKTHVDLSHTLLQSSFNQIWPILKPMTLGSLPLGLLVAACCYLLVKPMVEAYQRRHRRDLGARNGTALGS
jgi:uncharacterized protein (DUF2062 family)